MNSKRLQWRGEGPRILFLPGWNTPAQFLEKTIPSWFLERWRCGLLEWPGMGRRASEPPPVHMDGLVSEIASAMEEGPFVGVVGFCLGGVAAWEVAKRTQSRNPPLVMVESPYHFPLVIAPLLVPCLGPWLLSAFTTTRPGRACIERALFGRRKAIPGGFWETFGRSEPSTARVYLKILRDYERALTQVPEQPSCACHRILGDRSPAVLAFPLGGSHAIQAKDSVLSGVGHFPASEAPDAFFKLLEVTLS